MLLFPPLNWFLLLLQAAYVVNGNCKNVMNMSQSDQVELWRSVLNGMFADCLILNWLAYSVKFSYLDFLKWLSSYLVKSCRLGIWGLRRRIGFLLDLNEVDITLFLKLSPKWSDCTDPLCLKMTQKSMRNISLLPV